MFDDGDIDGAVAAGVLSPAAAVAFRDHLSGTHAAPVADEEQFRLITGFNDIFVSIATLLVLVAATWIGGRVQPVIGAAALAAVAWGLAEFFTRQRRMALPSIILLLAFVGGVFATISLILLPAGHYGPGSDRGDALFLALAAAVAGAAAWGHWWRFKVPITIAAGTAALVGLVVALALSAVPTLGVAWRPILFVAGLAVFAFAMRWDMSDPTRQTRRSDVAFWLHLLAAPLIVHPVFTALAAPGGQTSAALAVAMLALYLGLAVVALTIDRRALMVSALAYVLYAISNLFERFGAVSLKVALTALVIGSALLLLSAFWGVARAGIVARLPASLQDRLPPVTRRRISPRPA